MAKVTMLDIAEKVGVSKTTVSMVLNNKDINVSEDTRNKIMEAVKELNYIPNTIARSLSTRKTETLGVIIPDIENPFFAEMVKAIENQAESLNYNVILCNTYGSLKKEKKYVKLLISKLVDGIIFISGGNSEENLNILEDNKVPFIVVDRYIEGTNTHGGVFCSNDEGIELGIKYLYKKGHRNIAFVAGPKKLEISSIRLEAYKNVCKKLGIYNENFIFHDDFTIEGGIKSTAHIMSLNLPIDAIFYSSDVMALGGIKILTRIGIKIPDDISILGYDNINISSLIEPELTTIAQPIYKMGQEACKLLVSVINGSKNQEIYLKPELIERATVK